MTAGNGPDVAIRVAGVGKAFTIPRVRRATVREHAFDFFRRRPTDQLEVLKDVSFVVRRGESVGVMGRNGSGKSTLLKMIAGIYQPDRGTVDIHGEVTPILELGVGFNPELDAIDNVYLLGTVMGLSLDDVTKHLDEILRFAELERFARLKLQHFSSGMVARLAYSVAFNAVTDILLLDEIFAVGDAGFKARCEERYRQLVASGHTVLLVSHDPSTISDLCHRAVLLEAGEIVASGSAPDVAEAYVRLVGESGGGPPARKRYLTVSVGATALRAARLRQPPHALLACPACQGPLSVRPGIAACPSCAYVRVQHDDACLDLRPIDAVPDPEWEARQELMERWYEGLATDPARTIETFERDYSALIPTLRSIAGAVVDIGGALGLARQYIDTAAEYVVVEPSLFWYEREWRALEERFPAVAADLAFIRGVGERLPLRTGAFDAALALWSLNHAFDPQRVVEEAYRVLRAGGRFLVVLDDIEPSPADIADHPQLADRPRTGIADGNGLTESQVYELTAGRFALAARSWAQHYLMLEFRSQPVVADATGTGTRDREPAATSAGV